MINEWQSLSVWIESKSFFCKYRWFEMEVHTFTAAVRGFHYYRRFWRPKENEKLDCFYEPGNVFDQFAIKTVDERGETVQHLPKEISRVTKNFLDQGISMHCKLTSRHYRHSPLVQGGLEIKCEVVISWHNVLQWTGSDFCATDNFHSTLAHFHIIFTQERISMCWSMSVKSSTVKYISNAVVNVPSSRWERTLNIAKIK